MGVGLMLVKHPAKVLAHRAEALTKQELSLVNTSITFFLCGFCAVREDKLSRDWLV